MFDEFEGGQHNLTKLHSGIRFKVVSKDIYYSTVYFSNASCGQNIAVLEKYYFIDI